MAMRGLDPEGRNEIGRALYAARKAADVRQIDAAHALGQGQNKIVRIEHAQGHVLTPQELARLLDLYQVSEDERRRITAMVDAARDENIDARVILQSGSHRIQERFLQLAKGSRLVRSFVPNSVVGYLQTEAYIRVVMTQRQTAEQAAPSIQSRLDQQALMNDDLDREWRMIQTEGALRWNVGGAAVMVEQVDRLATEGIDRPNVKLGFIPWHKPVDLLPMTGFHIYDARAVVVGTWSGTAIIRTAEGIEMYEGLFDRVAALAVFEEDARTELQRIADDYRRLEAR